MRLRGLILLLCALAPTASATAAAAPPFPSKPIRLVIGSVPGGGNDLVGRILALNLTETLVQQVVVDNRGGANGIIGMELVAKAAPDGHTFYMGTAGHLSVNPSLYPKMPFNIGRDFTPLTQVVSLPFLIYLHPSLPARTLSDLLTYRLWLRSGRQHPAGVRRLQKFRGTPVGARDQGSQNPGRVVRSGRLAVPATRSHATTNQPTRRVSCRFISSMNWRRRSPTSIPRLSPAPSPGNS